MLFIINIVEIYNLDFDELHNKLPILMVSDCVNAMNTIKSCILWVCGHYTTNYYQSKKDKEPTSQVWYCANDRTLIKLLVSCQTGWCIRQTHKPPPAFASTLLVHGWICYSTLNVGAPGLIIVLISNYRAVSFQESHCVNHFQFDHVKSWHGDHANPQA